MKKVEESILLVEQFTKCLKESEFINSVYIEPQFVNCKILDIVIEKDLLDISLTILTVMFNYNKEVTISDESSIKEFLRDLEIVYINDLDLIEYIKSMVYSLGDINKRVHKSNEKNEYQVTSTVAIAILIGYGNYYGRGDNYYSETYFKWLQKINLSKIVGKANNYRNFNSKVALELSNTFIYSIENEHRFRK